jgi:hypothetical protein
MSAPLLMQSAAKSGYVAIQQESINEAASRVNMIMGYNWDEGNADETKMATILRTNGHADLNESVDVNISGRRAGTPLESYRTFLDLNGSRFDATASGSLGTNSGDEDDVDDFIGTRGLVLAGTGTGADYIETTTIDINTSVAYISDAPILNSYQNNNINFDANFTQSSGTPTNIKRITTTLTSTGGIDELEKEIILHGFSCNIGGYQLEERSF